MTKPTTPPKVELVWPEIHDVIHRSNYEKDTSLLEALLADGADLSQRACAHTGTDMTVLHTAATGCVEVMNLLLENGAQPLLEEPCGPGEEARWAGHTALQMAAKSGNREIAGRLLECGAEYDVFSASALGDVSRLEELSSQDPDVLDSKDEYVATPLHWAATSDQFNTATFLINHGAKVNAHDSFEETPLLAASVRRSYQDRNSPKQKHNVSYKSLEEFLLAKGAPIDEFVASALDHPTLIALLDENSGAATTTNSHGTTPLHWAARNGHIEAARQLLKHGAAIDAQDAIGCPPLWYAAYWGKDKEMTQFLCQQGAEVSIRNIWGKDISAYDCGLPCWSIIRHYRK